MGIHIVDVLDVFSDRVAEVVQVHVGAAGLQWAVGEAVIAASLALVLQAHQHAPHMRHYPLTHAQAR